MREVERGSEAEVETEASRFTQPDVREKDVRSCEIIASCIVKEELDTGTKETARRDDAEAVAGKTGKEIEHNPVTHYCITRADIPHGLQAAQLIHAAGESSPGNLPPHTYAIALVARDECALDELSFKLFQAGIKHKRIVECDAPYTNQLMALGIPPMPRKLLKPYLSQYGLLR